SVDLDFDLAAGVDRKIFRHRLHNLFQKIGLKIKDESQKTLQFFLKYPAKNQTRNTLKLEIISMGCQANDYQAAWLGEISRYAICQTQETMMANKLVAVMDRFKQHQSIAGRDLYDLHYWFSRGFTYKPEIIKARTGLGPKKYLEKLVNFIREKVTRTVIDQDINMLLPSKQFRQIRYSLKEELLVLLGDEIKRKAILDLVKKTIS
ncbi:nucleotidyl transferase AbiEii/AbiGii toxin family protein, partial [Patescibacteria group bacterium]|nr:nucleotidyl transferase AbiEii/AbiGii toxin family protein [Patescibacteria group bacterium]